MQAEDLPGLAQTSPLFSQLNGELEVQLFNSLSLGAYDSDGVPVLYREANAVFSIDDSWDESGVLEIEDFRFRCDLPSDGTGPSTLAPAAPPPARALAAAHGAADDPGGASQAPLAAGALAGIAIAALCALFHLVARPATLVPNGKRVCVCVSHTVIVLYGPGLVRVEDSLQLRSASLVVTMLDVWLKHRCCARPPTCHAGALAGCG